MKLGYIHINKEEHTKVLQVLKSASESVAIDKLGISRIHDAFAYLIFPEVSSTSEIHQICLSYAPML